MTCGLPRALALGWLTLAAATPAAADARTAGATECFPHKPRSDPRWWSYRHDVDGVRGKCWYPGKPGKPKTELRWEQRPSAERRSEDAVVQPPAPQTADPANTCCWPAPEELPPPPLQRQSTEPSFNQRWNDILNDMAMPVTRWRAPLKDQQRFINGD